MAEKRKHYEDLTSDGSSSKRRRSNTSEPEVAETDNPASSTIVNPTNNTVNTATANPVDDLLGETSKDAPAGGDIIDVSEDEQQQDEENANNDQRRSSYVEWAMSSIPHPDTANKASASTFSVGDVIMVPILAPYLEHNDLVKEVATDYTVDRQLKESINIGKYRTNLSPAIIVAIYTTNLVVLPVLDARLNNKREKEKQANYDMSLDVVRFFSKRNRSDDDNFSQTKLVLELEDEVRTVEEKDDTTATIDAWQPQKGAHVHFGKSITAEYFWPYRVENKLTEISREILVDRYAFVHGKLLNSNPQQAKKELAKHITKENVLYRERVGAEPKDSVPTPPGVDEDDEGHDDDDDANEGGSAIGFGTQQTTQMDAQKPAAVVRPTKKPINEEASKGKEPATATGSKRPKTPAPKAQDDDEEDNQKTSHRIKVNGRNKWVCTHDCEHKFTSRNRCRHNCCKYGAKDKPKSAKDVSTGDPPEYTLAGDPADAKSSTSKRPAKITSSSSTSKSRTNDKGAVQKTKAASKSTSKEAKKPVKGKAVKTTKSKGSNKTKSDEDFIDSDQPGASRRTEDDHENDEEDEEDEEDDEEQDNGNPDPKGERRRSLAVEIGEALGAEPESSGDDDMPSTQAPKGNAKPKGSVTGSGRSSRQPPVTGRAGQRQGSRSKPQTSNVSNTSAAAASSSEGKSRAASTATQGASTARTSSRTASNPVQGRGTSVATAKSDTSKSQSTAAQAKGKKPATAQDGKKQSTTAKADGKKPAAAQTDNNKSQKAKKKLAATQAEQSEEDNNNGEEQGMRIESGEKLPEANNVSKITKTQTPETAAEDEDPWKFREEALAEDGIATQEDADNAPPPVFNGPFTHQPIQYAADNTSSEMQLYGDGDDEPGIGEYGYNDASEEE